MGKPYPYMPQLLQESGFRALNREVYQSSRVRIQHSVNS
jgi:hypothetical protein